MEPPLPQLSGTAPTPTHVKWARRALFLSVAGFAALLASPFVLALVFVRGGRESNTIPLFGHEVSSFYLVEPFILGSVFFSAAGLIIGIRNKKTLNSKAARILGGITLALWLTIIGASHAIGNNARRSHPERYGK